MPLINTVFYLRKKNKWSRDFVSVETNICRRLLRYYEVGAVPVSLKFAERLANLYNCEPHILVGKNQRTFICDDEYDEILPQRPWDEVLVNKVQQFISGTLPKRSLKEVYQEVIIHGNHSD